MPGSNLFSWFQISFKGAALEIKSEQNTRLSPDVMKIHVPFFGTQYLPGAGM